MNLRPEDLRFAGGRIFAAVNPENSLSFARVAAASHWFAGSLPDPEPSALRETVFWSPLVLEAPNAADEINSSAVYGFVFDFGAPTSAVSDGESLVDCFQDKAAIEAPGEGTDFHSHPP